MLYPPINELLEIAENRYSLVIAASKRARDLIDGKEPLIRTVSTKPVTIATNEIYQGCLEIVKPSDNE
jgi:DNA-directed RNA polymerase subunit omega